MDDSNSQNTKHVKPYAKISVIVGLAGIVWLVVLFFTITSYVWLAIPPILFNTIFFGSGLIWLFGIYIGRDGQDTTKKDMATQGIILNIVCLVYWILLIGVYFWFWGWANLH